MPGKVQLIHIVFTNPYQRQELFKVQIDDPEYEYRTELQLVKSKEWEYWTKHSHSKGLAPKDFDLVSTYDDFLLEPMAATPLMFKFMTLRKIKPI